MKYSIDESVVVKHNLDLPSFFLMCVIKTGANIDLLLKNMLLKEYIVHEPTGYKVTQRWNDVCENIILTSESTIPKDDDLLPFAEKLMAIFPQGKKPGTPYYWKCNKREVALKLKSFYKLYGSKYTEEEILNAARKYVESFHGDYKFMRLLKYFIWKKEKETGEEVSELATIIDNGNDDFDNSDNWLTTLK